MVQFVHRFTKCFKVRVVHNGADTHGHAEPPIHAMIYVDGDGNGFGHHVHVPQLLRGLVREVRYQPQPERYSHMNKAAYGRHMSKTRLYCS